MSTINTQPPADLKQRIEAALGPTTEFLTECEFDRYRIGVRCKTAEGHPREKTYVARNQSEIDQGWRELTEIAEAELIKVRRP